MCCCNRPSPKPWADEKMALRELAFHSDWVARRPPLENSHFSGSIDLTLQEAKVEFKPIEPRNPRVDAVGSELGRQVLVVLP